LEKDEEKPQVIVLKSGDLTADEAERERLRLEKGNNFHSEILFKELNLQLFCKEHLCPK
jgi:hypothetical protein